MSRKFIQISFAILLLTGMIFGLAINDGALANAIQAPAAQGNPTAKIETQLLTQLNSGPADFIVKMAEQADISVADQLLTKEEKGQYVFETLVSIAARTQTDLRNYLDSQSVDYQSFYIVNAVWVKGGTLDLAQTLSAREDVAAITANHTFQLDPPIDEKPSTDAPQGVEPNISFVKADQVWAMGYTGQGMVVADDDTGLDASHPAILPHYRGCLNPPSCSEIDHNYNWYDAFAPGNVVPWDDYGHGTHTAGTMVGDDGGGNQIGLAPGAQLIACKNMQSGGGDDAHFLICFEWNLAPWDLNGENPRPDLAPDSINNSWGYFGGGNNVFRDVIDNLMTAGIVVEVSAGNEGSGCSTLRSPGDYQEVFTTGSVNHASEYPGTVTGFSSRGPSILDGNYFPDFMAPGENVRSSIPGNGYGYMSGTSMAGPHVAALIPLLWSANPALRGQIDTTYSIIQQTATPIPGYVGYCGGDYVTGPNNDWGYGTIDAYAAAVLAISYGGSGTLEGTVTDAVTALPVEGATVHAVRQEGGIWNTTTDASGFYQITVAAGAFDMTASHPHYVTQTANGVVVPEDGTTVQDFSLTPRGYAYGYVTDADNGTPLADATVSAEEGSFTTTDETGYYELWLDPGFHTLTAVAQDYAPENADVTIVSGEGVLQDFELLAAVVFVPSPVEVSVPLGSTFTQPATIINRLPDPYNFEFQEKDMGYLPLGGGQVKVSVKAGPVSAPANTAVAVSGYKARPAGTIDIAPSAGINQTNVLLLAADDDNNGDSPIMDMLLAYGDLESITLYDPRYNTPTLEELQAYNVVVVWANYTFADANGIGNVLADYVDAGGKVIDLNFALDPSWGYLGRFRAEGYSAITIAYTGYSTSCLGTFDAGHPIMDGVTDVCDYYRGVGSALTAGSYEVARWADNELFVAAKEDGSVVTINGYVGIYYQWTGQMADVLHNAINFIAVPADVPWLSEDPISGTVPTEGSLAVDINFDTTILTQPGNYSAELTLKGDPKVKVPVFMFVEAPENFGRLDGKVLGLGYCDANPAALEGALVEIVGGPTLETDAAGYYALWLAEGIYTVNVTAEGHLGASVTVEVIAGEDVTQDFDLRWDEPCITSAPPTMSVNLDMGASTTLQMTLTNNGAGLGTFEMSDMESGYTPMRQGFLPSAVKPSTPDTTPISIGRAPNASTLTPSDLGKSMIQLAGEPAFAMDVYPGYNLVTFLSDNPGAWTIIANIPGSQYFAGDFINGDFSTLYVIDYATNMLYAVDTTSGAVTPIGSSTPRSGETWTGMSGATDGTMYASSTNITRSTLYTVDLGTGAVTEIGEITNAPAIIDIAVTPAGLMYGVDIVNDNLIAIDPSTGAGTIIGYIGFNANYAQGMDFEETSGTLYMAAYSASGDLRIVDPATGNTTVVGGFPGGAEVDDLAFATGGGGDAPWLSESPESGEIPGTIAGQSAGVDSLSGSYVAFDPSAGGDPFYNPGADQTFCFRAETYTDDWGYVYNLWEKFPVDWIVNDAYVVGTPVCDSGTWGSFLWGYGEGSNEINIYHPRYQSTTDHCVAYYCFDVTTGTGGGNALESWYWAGDSYGNPPYHPCSDDGYTPSEQETCDEAINPLASIPASESGNTATIDVTFDASMVTQPGSYTGQVKAKTNDPVYKNYTVDVTMVVNAPADWGQLSGTVTGLGYCDADPAPLQGAQVAIEGGLTVETDADGYYLLWLQEGTYNVTVTADGHEVGAATVEILPGGEMTVQDFDLRWLQPCLSEEPASLEATLDLGEQEVQLVTLSNMGAAEGTFSVSDADKGYTPKIALKPPMPYGEPFVPQGSSSGASVQPFLPRINQNSILVLTTTDVSQSVGKALTELGYAYDQINVPPFTGIDFTPYDVVFLTMDGGLAEVSDIQLLRTNVIDEGKKLIFLGGTCYQPFAQGVNDYLVQNDVNNYCWQITNPPQWTIIDDTHPLADGLPDQYNYNNSSAGYYSIRVTDPEAEVVAVNGESWPAFFRKATDGDFIWYIDSVYSSYWADASDFAFLKQLISNSIEASGGGDALWLSEDPMAGVVAPDTGTQVISVTFDSSVVTQPGTYMAEIKIKTNDPVNSKFVIPVTMNVNGPVDYGRLEGIVQSLGYCDQNPAPLKNATVQVVDGPTLTTDAAGHYSIWLQEGTYELVVTADGHVEASATVEIVAQQTVTQDFDLRVIEPCTSVDPLSFEVDVAEGFTQTVPLYLSNLGAGESAFKVTEKATGLLNLGYADMNYARGTAAPSAGPVPGARHASPADIGSVLKTLTGAPANAMELIYQYLIYFEAETPGGWTNLYSEPGAFFAGDFINGDFSTLYAIDYNTNSLYAIDIATGAQTYIGTSVPGGGESWTGMTGANDGTMYASSSACGASSTLYTIDLATGALTTIGPITNGPCIIDIAITPDGTLYGEDIVNDVLLSIDPGTGAGTVIGPIGFDANYAQGMDYEEESGTLYLTSFNNATYDAELRAVDVNTGNTTLIGIFGNFYEVDSTGFATGGGNPDVPWLFESPVTGTVPADTSVVIDVTFDTITYTVGTTVTADLKVKTDDNNFTIPVTMHVIALTMPEASFTTNSPVKVGNPMVFINTSDPGNPPATEAEWDFGDGHTHLGTMDPVSHMYETYGTYTVTVTVCNAMGCDTATEDVVVIPKLYLLPWIMKNAYAPVP
jgi:subtilisin family serine protease